MKSQSMEKEADCFAIVDCYSFYGLWSETTIYVDDWGEVKPLLQHPYVGEMIEEAYDEYYEAFTSRSCDKIFSVERDEIPEDILSRCFHLKEKGTPVPGFFPRKGGLWFDATIYPFPENDMSDEELQEVAERLYGHIPKSCRTISIERLKNEGEQ